MLQLVVLEILIQVVGYILHPDAFPIDLPHDSRNPWDVRLPLLHVLANNLVTDVVIIALLGCSRYT